MAEAAMAVADALKVVAADAERVAGAVVLAAVATGGGGGGREDGEGVLPGVGALAACSGSAPSARSGTSSSDQSLNAVSSFF